MKIIMFGGDGYCGWPTSLYLAKRGFDVIIVDNLSRRQIDVELGACSLTPIEPIQKRIAAWSKLQPRKPIRFENINIAQQGERLRSFIACEQPDAVLHYAEQRAAPYSMKTSQHKQYTLGNNLLATFNLLEAVADSGKDTHFVHLGSMGVYGYFSRDTTVPEGYIEFETPGGNGNGSKFNDKKRFLCQGSPASIYHCTKMQDAILFQFYNQNNNMRITDLHQGVVWGTLTDETRQDEALINRFDYDGDYGTFINRFLLQATIGHPITLYGKGGQCRPIIHINDSMRSIELALLNPPALGDGVHIYNQMTEVYQIRDIAEIVAAKTGAEIRHVPNPRIENEDVRYSVNNSTLLSLGLKPTFISDTLLDEVMEVVRKHIDRCDTSTIMPRSKWRKDLSLENTAATSRSNRNQPANVAREGARGSGKGSSKNDYVIDQSTVWLI